MEIEKDIVGLLKSVIKKSENFAGLQESLKLTLDAPKNSRFGDISSNLALVLAQKSALPPLKIACQIQEELQKELPCANLSKKIARIEVKEPGFINFFLSKEYLYEVLLKIDKKKDDFGRFNLGQGQKVHIEFVSANPTGPLNVAHGRQAAFGDTLANLLQFAGYKVYREYYLNDEGVQIDILGESLRAKYLKLSGVTTQFPVSGYRGRYIDELAGELVQRYGRRLLKDNDKRLLFFSRFAYRRILKGIQEDLNAFDVNFNCWFSQKKLNKSGRINRVLKYLKKKGFIYQKEGAFWLASSKFGDDKDRVVIKSDSKLTYITPDIAYHQTKFERGFSRIINIWGPDHHGYIPRIKAAIAALGYDVKDVTVLIVQLVSLAKADKIIPMSTRLGQFVSLRDIIQAVGKDAGRFFFLTRNKDSHLHFDLELAKRESQDNPVYYIKYAHARILNILKYAKAAGGSNFCFTKKSDCQENRSAITLKRFSQWYPICFPIPAQKRPAAKEVDLSLLDKPQELGLIRTLRRFPTVVEGCVLNLEPHRITTYLYELAKDFHHYYEKYRVATEDLPLTQARLVLVNVVRIVLKNGLGLLAIQAPAKM